VSPPDALRARLAAFADALTARTLADADLSMLAGDADLARRRFGLYRGNVQANAVRALANAYPVVRALVGDEFFDGLAREYAAARPSSDGDLNATGEAFAAYLGACAHVADLPYLPDVARLEWLVHRAHYAVDPQAFDAAKLAAIAPAQLDAARLVLAPACALLHSRWPVATLWRVHQPAHEGELRVDLDAGGEHALVFRRAWRVDVEAMAAGAHAFLDACAERRTLAQAVAGALARDAAFDLAAVLPAWVANGVVADVVVP
jgi:hypothetical protein